MIYPSSLVNVRGPGEQHLGGFSFKLCFSSGSHEIMEYMGVICSEGTVKPIIKTAILYILSQYNLCVDT